MNTATQLHRNGQQHLANCQATIKRLWAQACEHDQIPCESKFVAFSDDNPFVKWHDLAIREYQRSLSEYQAGGYVGLTMRGR